MGWKIEEIELSDIGSLDPVEFTRRFRGERPVLLLYQLRELGWVGVAKCAPEGSMLWATELGGAGQHDDEQRWVKSLLPDRSIYETFCRELARAGIDRSAVPWDLLGPYCRRGTYFGRASLAFRPIGIGLFRVAGVVVPADHTDALVRFYGRQLEQFAGHAFWRAPEGEESSPDRLNVHRVAGGYLDARLWRHPLPSDFPDEKERQIELQRRAEAVRSVVDVLGRGGAAELKVHYHDAIRPAPTFLLDRRSAAYPTSPLDWALYSLRARLVRLLGWPNMYRSLMAIPNLWEDIEASETDSASVGLPYEIGGELRGFRAEMEQRYPVLREWPLIGSAR